MSVPLKLEPNLFIFCYLTNKSETQCVQIKHFVESMARLPF